MFNRLRRARRVIFSEGLKMPTKKVLYHAGCPVCLDAVDLLRTTLDDAAFDAVEVVHLGETRGRVAEAARIGVKSVPALVAFEPGEVPKIFHINFGASIDALPRG